MLLPKFTGAARDISEWITFSMMIYAGIYGLSPLIVSRKYVCGLWHRLIAYSCFRAVFHNPPLSHFSQATVLFRDGAGTVSQVSGHL